MYDYKKQLTPQNCEPETLELLSSNVYTVENPLDTNVDLTDLNLSTENKIQIPYNISRFVEDNEIKETNKIFKNGKYIYPLNWVNEMNIIYLMGKIMLDIITYIQKKELWWVLNIRINPMIV